MTAGRFEFRVRFEKRATANSTYGGKEGAWTSQFERWASITPMKGGEAVMADRLSGRQPIALSVYYDSETVTITSAWRVVELVDGGGEKIYAIKSPPADLDGSKMFLTMLCSTGGPDT